MEMTATSRLTIVLEGEEAPLFRGLVEKLHVPKAGFQRVQFTPEERALLEEMHTYMNPPTTEA